MKRVNTGLTILTLLISTSIYAQEQKTLILKTSPLSVIDFLGENVSFALEIAPKESHKSLELGVSVHFPNMNDWHVQNRYGTALKAEFRTYSKKNVSKSKPTFAGFYFANEIAVRLENYDKYDSYRMSNNDPESTETYLDYEIINRQEIRNTIKLGFQAVIENTITLDAFMGLGVNYHFTQKSKEVEASRCCPTMFTYRQRTDTGFGLSPFVGLKLGYIIRK